MINVGDRKTVVVVVVVVVVVIVIVIVIVIVVDAEKRKKKTWLNDVKKDVKSFYIYKGSLRSSYHHHHSHFAAEGHCIVAPPLHGTQHTLGGFRHSD